ncbi:hypothetical protein GF327_02010 [Candidatus Woesearchaeota archaeon]|nr:hypothetical protein [Candidatus Woesearchaeota archaeon]
MVPYYELFDFDKDPFSTNPKRFTDKLVNMDEILKEMYYRIKSANLLVVKGKSGFGRTSLLMHVAQRYNGSGKIIYINSEKIGKDLNITKVLKDKYGIIGKLLNKKPKNMVLLLDNAQNLSEKNNERIKFYFDQNYLRSIIFTCEEFKDIKISASLKDRIGSRIKEIPEIDEHDAVEIIRNRIGESNLLTDELIIEIFKRSDRNPKKMIKNCKKIAKLVVQNNDSRIKYVDVEKILGDKK